jgi:two-component system response regulator DctR
MSDSQSQRLPVAPTARIHVVDDDASVREALSSAISRWGFVAVPHASAEEFLADFESDVAAGMVLDINLPGMHGIDLLQELESSGVCLPAIVMSQDAEIERVVTAVQRGAVTFLAKPISPLKFEQSVRKLMSLVEEAAAVRREAMRCRAAARRLSPREEEVMKLLLGGASPKEVASLLGISLRTAHIHRSRVLDKFEVSSEVQLLRLQAPLGSTARTSLGSESGGGKVV